jgi:hypothetical protein
MQPSELENEVFLHRVVTEDGFEKIIPAHLDTHMRGRVLTILEARSIIAVLTGLSLDRVDIPMFEPVHAASPAEQIEADAPQPVGSKGTVKTTDPSLEAMNAAQPIADLYEQFARAA